MAHTKHITKSPTGTDNLISFSWLMVVALLPLFIYPAALLAMIYARVENGVWGSTLPLSSTASPEMIWIFPRVLLLLLFAVPGFVWLLKHFSIGLFGILVTAYGILFISSAIFSHDELQFILLGGTGRMDGVMYAVALVIFMLVGYYLSQSSLNVFHAFYSVASVGSVLEVFSLVAQRFGYDPLGPITRGKAYTDVLTGTIGNPGMLAGLLFPITLLSLGVSLSPKSSRYLRYWAFSVALITAAGISLTGNKSSFYGLILLIFAYAISQRTFRAFLAGAAIAFTLFLAPIVVPNHTSYKHPLIPTASVATRPALWKLTVKALAHTPGQPILGAGPDGLRLTILRNDELIAEMLKVYRIAERWPASRQVIEIKPLFSAKDPIKSRAFVVSFSDDPKGKIYRVNIDKAHNMLLDRAVRSGVLSAFIWAALYLVPIFRLYRSRDPILSAYAAALAGIFFYYLFWFPVPQVEPIHVAVLSLAWAISDRPLIGKEL